MPTMNKVFLIGNLTRDPELRVTPKGTSICQFGLAVNRQYKDESGATRDDTTFVDCEAWQKTAEIISKYLLKGAPVMIEGRLKLDQWEDKQSGQKRSKLKVVVENVQFLQQRERAGGDEQRSAASAPATTGDDHARQAAKAAAAAFDEDVPF